MPEKRWRRRVVEPVYLFASKRIYVYGLCTEGTTEMCDGDGTRGLKVQVHDGEEKTADGRLYGKHAGTP